MSDYLTTSDTARILKRAGATVLYYERTGRLKAIRTQGGIRLFERADVERLAGQLQSKTAGDNSDRRL
jgi:DNA-binding transcriptional MerR regulator